MVAVVFSTTVTNASAGRGNGSSPNSTPQLPNLENWHYKIPITIDTGEYNRTDYVISQTIDIAKELGGLGTFDSNSVRVIETDVNWTPQLEITSQTRWVSDPILEVTWVMGGMTEQYTQRHYAIYFDTIENGVKTAPVYGEYLSTEEDQDNIWISSNDYEVKINKDRGGSRWVKVNNVPRKGYVADTTWQSWHTDSINWKIHGATTALITDGPLYKTVKIISADGDETLYWDFYPNKMRIATNNVDSDLSFDTIAARQYEHANLLVWDDGAAEDLTKWHDTFSRRTSYFYVTGTEDGYGFWADPIGLANQTIINGDESSKQNAKAGYRKGIRWFLKGNESYFGFAKNDVIRNVVLGSEYPPKITREHTIIKMDSPTISINVTLTDQTIFVEGNLTVQANGSLSLSQITMSITGNVNIESNGVFSLYSTTLSMNCAYPGQYSIYVYGELYVKSNSKITALTEHLFRAYNFKVYGKMEMVEADVGWLSSGIQIYSDDVTISHCNVHDSDYFGIFINNSSPSITNNQITNCMYGIYYDPIAPNISNNDVTTRTSSESEDIVNISYGDDWENITYANGTHKITYGIGTYWDGTQWLPGDVALVNSTLAGFDYMCEKNTYKLYANSKSTNDPLFHIKYNGASVNWSFDSPNLVTSEVYDNTLVYRNIYDYTDIEYTILPRCLKETIIVNQKTNVTEYAMKLDMRNARYGYDNTTLDDNYTRGRLNFYDEYGRILWHILTPTIVDSNGNTTNNVSINITKNELKINIENVSFLDNAQYPIYIDPIYEVPSRIDTDTVWESGNTYILASHVLVISDVTLTIQPNVIVKFDEHRMLGISGNLIAVGTSTEIITFTSNSPSPAIADWASISIFSSGHLNMDFCEVQYAIYGINVDSASDNRITNSEISYSVTGILLNRGANNNIISDCNVHSNMVYGIIIQLNSNNNQITNCNIHSNGNTGIVIYLGSNNNIENCEIRSHNQFGILIGECSNSVVLNTNIQNHHVGIYLIESSHIKIKWCDISNCRLHGLSVYNSRYNIITNCSVSAAKRGIAMAWSDNNLVTNCNIFGNGYGVYLLSSASNSVNFNNINSNTEYQIYEKSNIYTNAESNWWGSDPPDTTKIYGNVDYEPWLTEPLEIEVSPPPLLQPPVAEASPCQIIAEINKESPEFDASDSHDPDGTIVSYTWVFGDETTYTETIENAPDGQFDGKTTHIYTYTYSGTGTYFATVTAMDDDGATDTDYLRVLVWDSSPDITRIEGNTVTDCTVGIYVGPLPPYPPAEIEVTPPVNIIDCTVYNNDYGIYFISSPDAPTIKTCQVFGNKIYDLYLSSSSTPIIIDTSYDRTHIYMEADDVADPPNADGDDWTDMEEIYVYGFNPYFDDPDKETEDADFDDDGLTNIEEGDTYGTDALHDDTDSDGLLDWDEVNELITTTFISTIDHRSITDYSWGNAYIYNLKMDGEFEYVTAKIGIKHTNVGDLYIDITQWYDGTGRSVGVWDREGEGQQDLYIERDLLANNPDVPDTDGYFHKEDFRKSYRWELRVTDYAEGNEGYIDYFLIDIQTKTNPFNPDTDGDSLSDYDEVYPTSLSYLSLTPLQFTRTDFSYTIHLTNVPSQSSWQDTRIRLEITINPSKNCYVTIKGPVDKPGNYEYGGRSSESFTKDGAALLGYAVADKSNSLRVTIIEGGNYYISLRRDDKSKFTATVTIATPSADEPPLFITVHERSSTPNMPIEKQLHLARALGFEWVRFDVYWKNVEPNEGSYNWNANHWEEYGRLAKKYGLKLYVNIGTHERPTWTSDILISMSTKQNHEKYFVRGIVERINNKYANMIVAWQAHNEPGWGGTQRAFHTFEEIMGFIREKFKPYQEIILNPLATANIKWRREDAVWVLGVCVDDEDAGIMGWLTWIGNSDSTPWLVADKVGFSNALTVTGVDVYPEFVDNEQAHVSDALDSAEQVRSLKSGREKWIIEMPAGFCRRDIAQQSNWIQRAINEGVTAVGLYQLVEEEYFKDNWFQLEFGTFSSTGAYGIVNKNGKLYSNGGGRDNQDYYLMITDFTGVSYDIVYDVDGGAQMNGWSFGTTPPTW